MNYRSIHKEVGCIGRKHLAVVYFYEAPVRLVDARLDDFSQFLENISDWIEPKDFLVLVVNYLVIKAVLCAKVQAFYLPERKVFDVDEAVDSVPY